MTCLRRLRLKRGVSILELAFKAGMDDGNFSKAERGYKRFSEKTRERIAELLCTSVSSLFDETGYAKQ